MKRLIAFAVVLQIATGTAAAQSLKQQLEQRKRELAELTSKIEASAGQDFEADRDLQTLLKTETLQFWADRVTRPSFTISAIGTKVESELVYKPGRYKIWLQPAQDVRLRAQFSPFLFSSGSNQLSVATDLRTHAEARVFIHAGGVQTNIFCETKPDPQAQGQAVVSIGQLSRTELPYVINLTQPSSIDVRIVCHLGALGNYPLDFPLNAIARELGRGTMKAGYSDYIAFLIPGVPEPVKLAISTKNPAVSITASGIDVRTDLDITSGLEAARTQMLRQGVLAR